MEGQSAREEDCSQPPVHRLPGIQKPEVEDLAQQVDTDGQIDEQSVHSRHHLAAPATPGSAKPP